MAQETVLKELEELRKENIRLKEKLHFIQELEDIRMKLKQKTYALEIANIGTWTFDLVNNTYECMDELYKIFGYEENDFDTFMDFVKIVHPDDRKKVQTVIRNAIENKTPFELMHRVFASDGTQKIVLQKGDIKIDTEYNTLKLTSIIEDLTKIKKLELGISNIDKTLDQFMHIIDEQVITLITDRDGNIKSTSEAFCDISGYSRDESIGKDFNFTQHPDVDKNLLNNLKKTVESGRIWRGEIKNINKNAETYWTDNNIYPLYDDSGSIDGFMIIQYDITQKKAIEEDSITDQLTDIFNRRYFNKIIKRELKRAKRSESFLSFAMLDVDHFKEYNDTYGHEEGDKVLHSIGKILKKLMSRGSDYVFRIGGEEFGVLFSEQNEEKSFKHADEIRKKIEEMKIPHEKNSASDFITVSLGVVTANLKTDADMINEHILYTWADQVLYKAKGHGRNQVQMYRKDDSEFF